MTTLQERNLYRDKEEDTVFRILSLEDWSTYIIEVNQNRTGVPKKVSTLLLQDKLAKGNIEAVLETTKDIPEDYELSVKQLELRDKRFEVVNSLWKDQRERRRFLEKHFRKGLYEEIAEKLEISTRAARTVVGNFLVGGMTRSALTPNYKKRGAPGRERSSYKRRPDYEGEEIVSITEVERERFQSAYNKAVLKEGKSYEQAYNYLLDHFYTRTIKDEEGKESLVYTSEVPTIDQFLYWVRKHRSQEKEVIGKKGKNYFDNNYRVDAGSSRETINGPGNLFEIDAVHCNVSLVSEFDRNLIIGRPLLYSAIDIYTGMVTGFYLGLENESWRTTAFTLMNVIENKVEFCRKYGIEITEDEWPSHHLAQIIKADKGAVNNPRAQILGETFHFGLTYTPAYSPRLKPFIEHRHKGYKEFFESNLKDLGADQWNSGKRGVEDARGMACLTLEELTRIVIKLTLKFNSTINEDYPYTPEMMAQGVSASPVELWNWGVKQGLATLIPVMQPEEFRLKTLKQVKRTISEKGVQINTHKYVPIDRTTARIFNNERGKSMNITYNENDITEVYLVKDGIYHRLKMKDFDEGFLGMSVKEDRILRRRKGIVERDKKLDQRLQQIDIEHYVKDMVRDNKETIPTSKSSRRKRVKEIEQNKQEYNRQTRTQESLDRKFSETDDRNKKSDSDITRNINNESFDKRREKFIQDKLKKLYEEME